MKARGLGPGDRRGPQAILYDEPTTGLDPVTSNTNDLIRSMQRRLSVTSVVVTHDIRSAFTVGDRIAFLFEGRLRFVGTVDEARTASDPVFAGFLAGLPHGEQPWAIKSRSRRWSSGPWWSLRRP